MVRSHDRWICGGWWVNIESSMALGLRRLRGDGVGRDTEREWRVYALDKTGVIPEEITTLQYLTLLKIDQNFFSGPLPAFIGNLTRLRQLSIAINDFSGSIPTELGKLKDLNLL
ncbi:LRR domain containing protein [Parasponia andersonii]|uniref:LRR domain containing protein n=1 Tax=Parasponia andersonii TaxID=3476 RepID=A0A2P5AV65_PARAD|nr:LRR domain containing protein [Parasponia andersonii]